MASLPGPSSTPYNWQNKATENFSRLCQLIVTICSDLFRDILSHYIPPANLRTVLDSKKRFLDKVKSINAQQKRLLYPDPGKASPMAKDLDFSVIYVLLRNICSIKPHKNGWGDNPENGDNSIAACIDRIRLQRNSISGHAKTGSMDNVSFHNTWTVLENSIIEIEKQLTGGDMYKRAVNALYLCELSPSSTKRYVEEITRTFKSEISKKKARIDDVESQLNQKTVTKKARLDNMEDQQHSMTQEFKERFEDFETSILSILQGRLHTLQENIEGRFNGMEQKLEGRLSALNKNIEGNLTGMEQKMEGRLQVQVSALDENINGKLTKMEQKLEEKISKMEEKVQHTLCRMILLPSAIHILTFSTPVYDPDSIAYMKSGTLWIQCFGDALTQVDTSGNVIDKVDSYKPFCVTEDGALLYASCTFIEFPNGGCKIETSIKKKTSMGTITLLKTEKMEHVIGIDSSFVNGHILILIGRTNFHFHHAGAEISYYKISKYDKNGVKIKDIEIDDRRQGQRKLGCTCIRENRNGDIIISCYKIKKVLGIDSSGGHRFQYSNTEDKHPRDICTDKYGHILVAFESSVHLLDEDGTLQKILLRNISSTNFTTLCLDDKQCVYIATEKGIVKVYKYLKN